MRPVLEFPQTATAFAFVPAAYLCETDASSGGPTYLCAATIGTRVDPI